MFKVGDQVRLTGENWESHSPFKCGDVFTIAGTKNPDFDGAYFMADGGRWYIYKGYEAELVTCQMDRRTTDRPRPDAHPNFIQVYVQDGRTITSYSASREVAGDVEYGTDAFYWKLHSNEVDYPADVIGFRRLLDEIESRMVVE